MLISQLLDAIDLKCKTKDCNITGITDDSRKCHKGSIFVCHDSGRKYVSQAIENGAEVVIASQHICENCIVVDDTRKIYSKLCAAYFGNCHKRLKLIGITGTNGKTTVSYMIYSILTMNGKQCGLIGTVENKTANESFASSMTTPDCFEMHSLFHSLVESGAEYCIIEASSQGLSQQRLYGLEFDFAVLTGISQDHLDYHGDMRSYVESKKELFKHSEKSVINIDSSFADEFISAAKGKVITYSQKDNSAQFVAKCIRETESSVDYALLADYIIHRIKVNTPGAFNAMNSLAAIAVCYKSGISLEGCAAALRSFSPVKGRMEILDTDSPFKVIIDYAHTPESLRQALLSLKKFPHSRLITLFGCGGDRDTDKRSLMGKTATELSDIVIVTSDNPRGEKPMDIIDDILEGTKKSKTPVYIYENRQEAIEYALKTAQKNDIILLAGKGHETWQILHEEKIHFDEREIVKDFLNKCK